MTVRDRVDRSLPDHRYAMCIGGTEPTSELFFVQIRATKAGIDSYIYENSDLTARTIHL